MFDSLLHPFRTYAAYRSRERERDLAIREAEREERRQERQVFATAIEGMTTMTASAFAAQREQAALLQKFLDSFAITESPRLREWDEEADYNRYVEKQAAKGYVAAAIPELAGLDKYEAFKAVLDRMEQQS